MRRMMPTHRFIQRDPGAEGSGSGGGTGGQSPRILAVTSDLIFATKIASTAQAVGRKVRTIRTVEALRSALREGRCRLVLLDLGIERFDPVETIRWIKTENPNLTVKAFVSHVRADLIDAARAAGCDEVMARSKFSQSLSEILSAAPGDAE